MNKKFLINAPIGAGVGAVIYSGCFNGFSHIDWCRVLISVTVAFIISIPFALFSRQKQ